MEIIFTHDCNKCNTEMEHRFINTDDVDNKYSIMFLAQIILTCPDCRLQYIMGDIIGNIMNENKI